MVDHQLWSFSNALLFIILIIIVIIGLFFGLTSIFNIRKIKNNWSEERCKLIIMPLAGLFGYDTKENFEFCMGKIFQTHSQSHFSSIGTILGSFTSFLTMIFGAISSLRNIIASLGGGINVIFQEFTERISNFFFKLRLSAIRIKQLIGRMYAILFSVMYMGLSGITGMTSFTNTFLFSFLDTFCFPEDTELNVLNKGFIPIHEIKIGDTLLPTCSEVTGTFQFYSKGQPMVKLNNTIVSTNHYVKWNDKFIKAGDHPNAIPIKPWDSNKPLYCLNTSNHLIPIDNLLFLDYDETDKADNITMKYIQSRLNGINHVNEKYMFNEYCPAISENTIIKLVNGTKSAKEIKIGDKLITGSEVIGLIKRKVNEICQIDSSILTASTLIWMNNEWIRAGQIMPIQNIEMELISFIVVPNSQIELESGLRIRDYMELCSPDSEMYYSKYIET